MEKKHLISFVRADNTSALVDFTCGVKSMDEFIHDKEKGLEKFIHLKLSNLWIVYENEKVVAFFALSKDSIILNSEDRRILESKELNNAMSDNTDADFFWEKEKYPAVEIDY